MINEIANKYSKATEFIELFESLSSEEKTKFYLKHPDLPETLHTLIDFIRICDDTGITNLITKVN